MWLWGLRDVCSTCGLAGEEGGKLPPHGAGVTLSATVFVFPLTPAPLRGGQGRRALVHPAVIDCHCPLQVAADPCQGGHCAMLRPELGFEPQAE